MLRVVPSLPSPLWGCGSIAALNIALERSSPWKYMFSFPSPISLWFGVVEEVVGGEDHFGGEVLRNQTCLPIPHYLGFPSLGGSLE